MGAVLTTKSVMAEITLTSQNDRKASGSGRVLAGMLKILVFLLLSLLPVNGNMRGEDKPPLRLTLRDAVQLALKENPQVQIANLNVAQSGQDDAIARAALLPQAGIEVYDRIQRFNLEAFIGRSFPGSPQHAGPFQTFQAANRILHADIRPDPVAPVASVPPGC